MPQSCLNSAGCGNTGGSGESTRRCCCKSNYWTACPKSAGNPVPTLNLQSGLICRFPLTFSLGRHLCNLQPAIVWCLDPPMQVAWVCNTAVLALLSLTPSPPSLHCTQFVDGVLPVSPGHTGRQCTHGHASLKRQRACTCSRRSFRGGHWRRHRPRWRSGCGRCALRQCGQQQAGCHCRACHDPAAPQKDACHASAASCCRPCSGLNPLRPVV
jgi:hypothetical protein